MARYRRDLALVTLALFSVPSVACAQTSSESGIPAWLQLTVSGLGLAVAVILLVGALRVRQLALGGIVAEKISLVILAIVCLATAALVQWVLHFLPAGLSEAQARFAAQLLVIAAMALLTVYFYGMYRSMKGYMSALTGSQKLAREVQAPKTLDSVAAPATLDPGSLASPAALPAQPQPLDDGGLG
jgi:hypothetical protein